MAYLAFWVALNEVEKGRKRDASGWHLPLSTRFCSKCVPIVQRHLGRSLVIFIRVSRGCRCYAVTVW